MKQLIREIKSRYDDRFIIFDSPPVEQTVEPKTLADEVDGIILVVASGQADREQIKKSVQKIGRDKILGIVFNKSREKSKTYQYKYYYTPQDTK